MKKLRLAFAVALVGAILSACSGPPITYPQPKDDQGDPPPSQGFTATQHR
jgi:hypothetical protein